MSESEEAPLERGAAGLAPAGPGWFVVNVAEAAGRGGERMGRAAIFQGAERFAELGINVRVLEPGQYASKYHAETVEEAFLVLSGTCVVVIDGQERELGKGDFLFLPAGVAHVAVGAGDGPCTVLMAGARGPRQDVTFPVDETAARYGASVEEATSDVRTAYADVGEVRAGPLGEIPW